ncbi:MAG: aconitate hydratase AcnA [Deltaproteobacteria bacterium]|nr:MAG: aconitate hydratase AcnA [Deltaproteobacteria bacterium]
MARPDPYNARTHLDVGGESYGIYALDALGDVDNLPYSIKVLLESCLRNCDEHVVTREHVDALKNYDAKNVGEQEIAFTVGRVVLQDFTGVPAVVDFAALRSAMERMGGDVSKVNPLIRADLVIDHSVQVDEFGIPTAMGVNTEFEFQRNQERYEFLKWGQKAFDNFGVVPPATGIVHQVNLEYLAGCVLSEDEDGTTVLFPDSLVGTDSHTTMINGLGVVGWGVGGIEAEAAMLGQPIYMLIPEVVGFELTGKLVEGITATDLVLTVTQMLRAHGVVGKFVEFYGEGLDALSLADRATIANMAPEYGATMGFFPIDGRTLEYLRLSNRSEAQIARVEAYAKRQGLWRDQGRNITYSSNLSLDIATVQPSLAGPKRPQDRIVLKDMQSGWQKVMASFGHDAPATPVKTSFRGHDFDLEDGDVVIAAITSCTNTSNPDVMIGAGLVAKKAADRGVKAKPWVKTSLAPGSRVVSDYLDKAGLTDALNEVGFYTVGYGCTTCIGNSGPLPDPIRDAVVDGDLLVTSVLSGNRNFEGRVSPHTRGNYLASPMLVVAYAIAGTVEIDLQNDPLATDKDGNPVYLKDIWPTNDEIRAAVRGAVSEDQFEARYSNMAGPEEWQALEAPTGQLFDWKADSTYIQEPPFFVGLGPKPDPISPISGARCLVKVGQSVTTDHISPAGAIPPVSPAADYLRANGVARENWNSFGSRRGNDRVMTRGTFANIRLRNQLAPGTEGGYTTYLGPDETPDGPFPWLTYESDKDPKSGEQCFIYDASVKYQKHQIPLVVLAGGDYGMGSSRDWAAKGTYLLGVKAVIAKSYERIHRSNLVGMGVLPLQFKDGEDHESLGLTGEETFDIPITDTVQPLDTLVVTATAPDGSVKTFETTVRIDTPVEVDYYRNGGILHTVLRKLAAS